MADNGNSKDYKLFREYLRKDKLIPYLVNEHKVHLILKIKMNKFIEKHSYTIKQNGWNRNAHREIDNLVINLNQIRQKYWFFESLKIK